ncbi:hypothetical protein quinque_015434 [Culex quinquefasciatus]
MELFLLVQTEGQRPERDGRTSLVAIVSSREVENSVWLVNRVCVQGFGFSLRVVTSGNSTPSGSRPSAGSGTVPRKLLSFPVTASSTAAAQPRRTPARTVSTWVDAKP